MTGCLLPRVLLVAALAAAADCAVAQPAAAPFPAGKPIAIHVGTTPGGGNDNVMRLVARHIGKYLPGNPNVVAKNTPGAGVTSLMVRSQSSTTKSNTPSTAVLSDAVFSLAVQEA